MVQIEVSQKEKDKISVKHSDAYILEFFKKYK